jgi:hypothetical protein
MALEDAIFTDVFVRKLPLPATDQSPLLAIRETNALEIVTPLLNVAVLLNWLVPGTANVLPPMVAPPRARRVPLQLPRWESQDWVTWRARLTRTRCSARRAWSTFSPP